MRTVDEIVAKLRDPEWADMFGTRNGDLIEWLPFEQAWEFLRPDVTPEEFAKLGFPRPLTDEAALAEIRGYMPFAWDKANNCRGLSAGRSILHMQAWLWLLGADDAVAALDEYRLYGKPQLRSICEAVGVDWKALDDGRWTNAEDDEGAGPCEGLEIVIPGLAAAKGATS